MSTDLKQQVALTALNSMMAGTYFDICTIDNIAKMLEIHAKGEAYNTLRPLHCIHWSAMPQEVREAVPSLIQECLGVAPAFRFQTMERHVIDIIRPPRSRFMRLLGRPS